MPEIYLCEIDEAYARSEGKGCEIELHIPGYPVIHKDPKMFDRGEEGENFALAGIRRLEENGEALIATPDYPLKPPSAGVLDVLVDSEGKIKYVVMFEKDKGSLRTPGFHTTFHGYPNKGEEWVSLKHLDREAAEEVLYVSDGSILLPHEYGDITRKEMMKMAEKSRKGGYEMMLPNRFGSLPADFLLTDKMDRIVMCDHRGNSEDPEWYSHTGSFAWYPYVDLIKVRGINLPVEGLMVYDAEGFFRDAVLIKPEYLEGKVFGDMVPAIVMENPKNDRGIPVPGRRTITEKEVRFKPILAMIAALHGLGLYPKNWIDELIIDSQNERHFFE